MAAPVTWMAFVDDAGHFALDRGSEFRAWVKKFAGQELVVRVSRRPSRQGTQAMRYYRGVVVPDIATACGYTDPDDYESVHDALAWKFLRLPDHPQLGTPRRRSTGKDDLTAEEMSAYLDQVIQYAETTIPGCTIRRPEDVDFDRIVDPEWT